MDGEGNRENPAAASWLPFRLSRSASFHRVVIMILSFIGQAIGQKQPARLQPFRIGRRPQRTGNAPGQAVAPFASLVRGTEQEASPVPAPSPPSPAACLDRAPPTGRSGRSPRRRQSVARIARCPAPARKGRAFRENGRDRRQGVRVTHRSPYRKALVDQRPRDRHPGAATQVEDRRRWREGVHRPAANDVRTDLRTNRHERLRNGIPAFGCVGRHRMVPSSIAAPWHRQRHPTVKGGHSAWLKHSRPTIPGQPSRPTGRVRSLSPCLSCPARPRPPAAGGAGAVRL